MKAAKKRQLEAMKKHQQHMRYLAKRNALNAILYRNHEWPFDWQVEPANVKPSLYSVLHRRFAL
jgi:hypothetical protein